MENEYEVNKIFEKIDFNQIPLKKGEYENCTFVNCNFNSADLSNIIFFSVVGIFSLDIIRGVS